MKKVAISLSIISCFLFTGVFYSNWRTAKEQQEFVSWVESNGGDVICESPEWINKCPDFSQAFLRKVLGENITYIAIGEEEKLTDLTQLHKLKRIRLLNISNTSISDLSILKDLRQLEELGVHHFQLSNMSSLKALTQLKVLHIKIRGIRAAQVSENLRSKLKNILPKCEIRFSAG